MSKEIYEIPVGETKLTKCLAIAWDLPTDILDHVERQNISQERKNQAIGLTAFSAYLLRECGIIASLDKSFILLFRAHVGRFRKVSLERMKQHGIQAREIGYGEVTYQFLDKIFNTEAEVVVIHIHEYPTESTRRH